MATTLDEHAERELRGIIRTIDAGGWIEAGRLGHPTVLSDAGLIEIGAHGEALPTQVGRDLVRTPKES